ncbi:hypothetical protein HDU84_006725 [Entophlyctis sp. JEL0112]|nr:hypothetical protein HDU84_006725 [Entophlyctis sp. JEL0112]
MELHRNGNHISALSASVLSDMSSNSDINPQGLNASEFSSLTSDLLSDNMTFSKCWNGSRYGWEARSEYVSFKRTLNLEQDAWDSARLVTNLFYRLAGEVMGFKIRYTEYIGGYDNVLGPRLAADISDVVMEMWTTGIPVTWFDHGSIGYSGRSGMYVPSWLADNYPAFSFDFWRFFENPAAVSQFQKSQWDLGDFNSHVCDTPILNGSFMYHYERMIDGLKINASVLWLGDSFYDYVDQALANGTARLMFPDSDNGMTQKWLLNPIWQPIQADEPTTIITKATPFDFSDTFPEITSLLSLITIAENEINEMLINMAQYNWTYDQAVCEWMQENEAEWSNWIPSPPTSITSCGIGEGLYTSKGISFCLSCPSGTFNWQDGISSTCLPCPSNAVCLGGTTVHAATGYWISQANFTTNLTMPEIYSCPYSDTCCSEASCPPAETCRNGFTGILCTQCIEPGHFLWKNECLDCQSSGKTVFFIVAGSLLATFFLVFVPQHETPTVELLLFYFQVINLIFQLNITNFTGMQSLQTFLALASLDIDGMAVACPAAVSGVQKQLFRFVLPCLFFLDTLLLYFLAQAFRSYFPDATKRFLEFIPHHGKSLSVKVLFLKIGQIVITFVLMPLVEASLSILDCRNVMGVNVDFQAPDAVCFSGIHLPAAIFAIVVLVVLLFVYPCVLVWKLQRIYSSGNLKYEGDDSNITVIDELNMTLYSDYRRSYFYMGPVLIWEKGLIVLLFKLLAGKISGIGLCYVIILAIICFQRIYVQPYLYGIEAYMNREICLCWLVLLSLNLSTLQFNQDIQGVIAFVIVLPAALHLLRRAHGAYYARSDGAKSNVTNSNLSESANRHNASSSGLGIERSTTLKASKKGREMAVSIENLNVRRTAQRRSTLGSQLGQSPNSANIITVDT